jgi:hypothetical protein
MFGNLRMDSASHLGIRDRTIFSGNFKHDDSREVCDLLAGELLVSHIKQDKLLRCRLGPTEFLNK